MDIIDLQTTEIVAMLTLVALIFTATSSSIRNIFTTGIEELLLTDSQYLQKQLLSSALFSFIISMFTFMIFDLTIEKLYYLSLFSMIRDIVLYLSFLSGLIMMSILYIIVFKKKDLLFSAKINLIIMIVCLIFLSYAEYAIGGFENESRLLLKVIVSWMAVSILLFLQVWFWKVRVIKTSNLRIRILTNEERERIFFNGTYHVKTISTEIHVVSPVMKFRKLETKFPQYIFFTQTDKIHVFEKDDTLRPSLRNIKEKSKIVPFKKI